MNHHYDAHPFIQRIFRLAADRVGGAAELAQHIGMTHSELEPYLRGEAIPPLQALLKAVDLVVEQVNLADRPWQSVLLAYRSADHE